MARRLGLLVCLSMLLAASSAGAATFSITIRNTSTYRWSTGLITFSPLLPPGPTPTSGAGYIAYSYSTSGCNVYANDDGDATALAQHLGLTLGSDAFLVPSINAGASATVTITASPGQEMSYLSAIYGSGTEAEDDVVLMHVVGNPSDLGVPLFDGNGLPLANVAFALSGFDNNSTSASSGTAASCSPKCPVPSSGCYVSVGNGTTGQNIPAQPLPSASNLSLVWSYAQAGGYTTDGLALGNLTGNSTNELVVLMEGGQNTSAYNPLATGRAIVLSQAGGLLSSFDATAGHELMGIPLIENLNGGTTSEYLVSEFGAATPMPGAAVFARQGSSTTAVWTSTGYGYPGFWNMGPMSGNLRSDVGSGTTPEIISATWAGDVAVLNASTGATVNTYSTYTALGEQVYGHVAVGNVVGTSGSANELVGFGATTGTLFALTAPTGTGAVPMTVAWQTTVPGGSYAFGSGPAIGDLDGDGNVEIVVAAAGTGQVYAFDARSSTTCKYRWLAPGGFDYAWSSPVIGDVDGDGVKEVVVFSSDSVLSVLARPSGTGTGCRDGVVEWTYTVGSGGAAWFTPALGQLVGSGTTNGLDVVVANYTTLEVVDVTNRRVAYRYVDPTAQFFPSALIGAATGSPAQIYVSGWLNGKVYRLDTPTGAPAPVAWPAFMGGNTRTGAR